jgi:hypothetical protein
MRPAYQLNNWDMTMRHVYCLVDGKRDIPYIARLLHKPVAIVYSHIMDLYSQEYLTIYTEVLVNEPEGT